MKILHVTAPAAFGGLERVVEALSRGHVARGVDVAAALVHEPDAPGEDFATSLAGHGVHVHRLVLSGRSYARERELVASICRDWKPDVMHTHGYRSDVLMGSVARSAGVPQVTTVHGFTGGGWKNRIYETLQKRAFCRCAGVVAVSAGLVEALTSAGVAPERLWVVPNAWGETSVPLEREQARAELGLAGDAFQLGWVGRLSPEKAADVLVAAIEMLGDIPLTASFIGDGPDADLLRRRTMRLQEEGRIRWHGAIPDAGRLFRAFDGFVLSSRTEGTPIALLEAIASGVPVVATAVGGVPDVVGSGDALLVPAEQPAELAAAIRRLWSDRGAAHARAESAANRLRNEYAVDPWLDRYEAVYRQVCPDSRRNELCKA